MGKRASNGTAPLTTNGRDLFGPTRRSRPLHRFLGENRSRWPADVVTGAGDPPLASAAGLTAYRAAHDELAGLPRRCPPGTGPGPGPG